MTPTSHLLRTPGEAQLVSPVESVYSVIITAAENPGQVAWCLGHFRRIYPTMPALLVSDGPRRWNYEGVVKRFSMRLVEGLSLKRATCGGQWWARFVEYALEFESAFVLKVDPDAMFQRPFEFPPL